MLGRGTIDRDEEIRDKRAFGLIKRGGRVREGTSRETRSLPGLFWQLIACDTIVIIGEPVGYVDQVVQIGKLRVVREPID